MFPRKNHPGADNLNISMSSVVMAAVFMLNPQAEGEQNLPAAVEALKTDYANICTIAGGAPSFTAGFVNPANFNGDGKPDFVVDAMGFICQGSDVHFCGESGCQVTVFVSSGSNYGRAFHAKVQGYGVYRRGGRDVFEVITPENPCGDGKRCDELAELKNEAPQPSR